MPPPVVREVHSDFIAAGADIITINSYGIVKSSLAWAGIEDRFEELNLLACDLAKEARDASGREVLVAGSLPAHIARIKEQIANSWDFRILANSVYRLNR